MSVRANWYLGDLDLPADEDPAAAVALLCSAAVIDLRSSADIAVEFRAAVASEAFYATTFSQECDLKWSVPGEGGMRNPCHSCTMFCADPDHPDALLCSLGRRQEDLLDAFTAARAAEELDMGMLVTVECQFDAAQELAEALL